MSRGVKHIHTNAVTWIPCARPERMVGSNGLPVCFLRESYQLGENPINIAGERARSRSRATNSSELGYSIVHLTAATLFQQSV